MQRSKSSRARSSFTHRKRQRTPSAVDPIPDAVAEHESPPVDMALPAAGAEKQPAVIGTLTQVARLLWDDNYMARFEEEADQLERRWGLMTAAKELKAKAPESSYAARGLIQHEERHSLDEWFRELQMANAALTRKRGLCARRARDAPKRALASCCRPVAPARAQRPVGAPWREGWRGD